MFSVYCALFIRLFICFINRISRERHRQAWEMERKVFKKDYNLPSYKTFRRVINFFNLEYEIYYSCKHDDSKCGCVVKKDITQGIRCPKGSTIMLNGSQGHEMMILYNIKDHCQYLYHHFAQYMTYYLPENHPVKNDLLCGFHQGESFVEIVNENNKNGDKERDVYVVGHLDG